MSNQRPSLYDYFIECVTQGKLDYVKKIVESGMLSKKTLIAGFCTAQIHVQVDVERYLRTTEQLAFINVPGMSYDKLFHIYNDL